MICIIMWGYRLEKCLVQEHSPHGGRGANKQTLEVKPIAPLSCSI